MHMADPLGKAPTAGFLETDPVLGDTKDIRHPSARTRFRLHHGLCDRAGGALIHLGHDTAIDRHMPGQCPGDGAIRLGPGRCNPGTLVCDAQMTNQLTPPRRTAQDLGGSPQPGFEVRLQQAQLHLELFGHAEALPQVRNDLDSPPALIYPKAPRKCQICLDCRVPRKSRARASTPHVLRDPRSRTSHLETWMKQHKPVFTPPAHNDTPLARPPQAVANP